MATLIRRFTQVNQAGSWTDSAKAANDTDDDYASSYRLAQSGGAESDRLILQTLDSAVSVANITDVEFGAEGYCDAVANSLCFKPKFNTANGSAYRWDHGTSDDDTVHWVSVYEDPAGPGAGNWTESVFSTIQIAFLTDSQSAAKVTCYVDGALVRVTFSGQIYNPEDTIGAGTLPRIIGAGSAAITHDADGSGQLPAIVAAGVVQSAGPIDAAGTLGTMVGAGIASSPSKAASAAVLPRITAAGFAEDADTEIPDSVGAATLPLMMCSGVASSAGSIDGAGVLPMIQSIRNIATFDPVALSMPSILAAGMASSPHVASGAGLFGAIEMFPGPIAAAGVGLFPRLTGSGVAASVAVASADLQMTPIEAAGLGMAEETAGSSVVAFLLCVT